MTSVARLIFLVAVGLWVGCASPRVDGVLRNRVLPPFVVVLWVDWAVAGSLADPATALDFCQNAKGSGVTHLALEARTADGREALGPDGVHETVEASLRSAAAQVGLPLAVVLPCFLPDPTSPPSDEPLKARWNGEGWDIQPLLPDSLPPKASPASEKARSHDLRLFTRLAEDPAFELVLLSGFGFEDSHADVSPTARSAFEQWRGGAVRDWPGEVLGNPPPITAFGREDRGPLWDAWVAWRARVLRDQLVRMRSEIGDQQAPPRLIAVVDAPYPAHQRQGLNWASPGTPAEVEHGWLAPDYGRRTAAGHLLDGVALLFWEPDLLNAPTAEAQGFAWWASLEGASALARRARRPDQSAPWFAVPMRPDSGWELGVRGARLMAGGVVLVGSSAFLAESGGWEKLRQALTAPQ
jgi:hypothetical protein